jgi:hypothetical protein
MILSLPSMWPHADRVRQSQPELFGNDPQTWRSDFTEREPGIPQLLLVEQPVPGSTVLAHYHSTDQYQIFMDGGGKLGRHDIHPISVHYTNRYTGYGPIVAGESGVSYYVFRPEFDRLVTGQYLHIPELREKVKRQPGRKRSVIIEGVALKTLEALSRMSAPVTERILDLESDPHDPGTFADVMSMGPNVSYTGPDPDRGGGQVFLVVQGSMRCEGTHYSARSGLAVTRDEKAIAFTSGDAGVQVLVLQYPRRDTPPENAPIK